MNVRLLKLFSIVDSKTLKKAAIEGLFFVHKADLNKENQDGSFQIDGIDKTLYKLGDFDSKGKTVRVYWDKDLEIGFWGDNLGYDNEIVINFFKNGTWVLVTANEE